MSKVNKQQQPKKTRKQKKRVTKTYPKRPWRDRPEPSLQKLLGERGTDINAPSNSLEAFRAAQLVSTMTKVLPVTATVSDKAINNCALGIILHALKHGLAAATDGPSTNPYYMYKYLETSIRSAMQGVIPSIQQAPVWFWELLYAVRKKQAPFKLSQVNYSWDFSASAVGDDSPIPMGVGGEAYSVVLTASLSTDSVLGFPALGPNVPYTQDLGADAIGNLWAYCAGSEAMTKLIGDPGEKAFMYKDTSSFSVVYPELGGSYETSNALRSTIYSERVIQSPLFAKFASYQPEGTENYRGWQKAGVTGGSSGMIGPAIAQMTCFDEIRAKVPPTIKFYNFDEFFEVLSLTLAGAMSPSVGRASQAISPCPLSPIEAQILLRQTMIPLFSNEQCQDIRMSQSNTELMLPFTVGQNGVSQGTSMLLPTSLAENIRSCKSFSNRIVKDNPRTTLHVKSILGRPANKPQLDNYLVESGPLTVYSTGIDSQLIRLIDCSSIQQNQVLYLDLTREQIKVLEESWNTWITGLTTNLSPLVSIGQTDGIAILKTCTLTNFQGQLTPITNPPNPAPVLQKKNSKVICIKGLARKRLGASGPLPGTGYFDLVIDRYTTSLQVLNSPCWKYLANWILPVSMSNPSGIEEQSIQAWGGFYSEAYRVPRSTAGGQGIGIEGNPGNSVTAYDRHVTMAQFDVKSIATDGQNEIIDGLLELGREGRGSFLDAIASLVGPAINAIGLL